MSKTEEDLLAAINTGATDMAKIKAWYKQFPFYAGLIVGGIVVAVVRHFV
jgi:20S proteasome alpha/beta subunit